MTAAALRRIIVVAFASLALSACGINKIPTEEEAAKAQWGNVESALQNRSDVIPNLVSVVQAAAISEQNVLTEVTDARARATSINITTDDLSNPAEFKKFQDAQNELTQALGQLRTVVENYPQLQSQARFGELMVAIEQANNQVNTERVRYNDKARAYNTVIRTFPSSITAKVIYGADPLVYFEASESAKENPEVDMSAITGGSGQNARDAGANDNEAESGSAAAGN